MRNKCLKNCKNRKTNKVQTTIIDMDNNYQELNLKIVLVMNQILFLMNPKDCFKINNFKSI